MLEIGNVRNEARTRTEQSEKANERFNETTEINKLNI